nr:hypothetical protein Iba_chr04aCG17740 [Ipomoea batatas]
MFCGVFRNTTLKAFKPGLSYASDSWGVEIHLQTWILEVLTEARLLLIKPLAAELRWVLAAFLAAGELTYIFRLGFLRQGVSCCTSHAADENCASAKSSISTATIMRLKDFILVATDNWFHCYSCEKPRSTMIICCTEPSSHA